MMMKIYMHVYKRYTEEENERDPLNTSLTVHILSEKFNIILYQPVRKGESIQDQFR